MSEPLGDDSLVFGEVRDKSSTHSADSPDTNGHLSIVAVSPDHPAVTAPVTKVYVDLDSLLDMHDHAVEDTSVELGGILLGHRGNSSDGTPFVHITDSVRARHYRATRGSFTFTHETWADINSQRSQLPDSTEIVGWYHTHPGWGVFLSDMDVFICNHFFANPDDVALVIDPTTSDTGLFVRRQTPLTNPPRRLPAFFLTAHRKRIAELTQWAHFFSGNQSMSPSPSIFSQRSLAPIVITQPPGGTSDSRLMLHGLMIAALIGQLLLLALVVARPMVAPPQAAMQAERADSLIAREQIVDSLLKTIAASGPDQLVQDHRRVVQENAELRAGHLGLMAQINQLERQHRQTMQEEQRLQSELASKRKELAESQAKLAEIQPQTNDRFANIWTKQNIIPGSLGAILGLLLGAAATAWLIKGSGAFSAADRPLNSPEYQKGS